MDSLQLGIDEAGRGPVIGALFISGVVIDSNGAQELFEQGARDSKKLSKEKREELYPVIEDKSDWICSLEVKASEIDFERQRISLNELEAQKMAKIISKALEQDFELDRIVMDLPDPNAEKFLSRLRKYVDIPEEVEVKAEHGADDNYAVCSAASIIAKVNRDNQVSRLSKENKIDLKTGYPHEKKVQEYLRDVMKEEGEYPDFVRTSWETAERAKNDKEQSKIDDY